MLQPLKDQAAPVVGKRPQRSIDVVSGIRHIGN
jgi:hypothetical protein